MILGLVGLALAAGQAPAWAQVTAAISGKVEDASGAAVAGAKVTVKSLETGATRETTTDSLGDFLVPALPLGPQEVRAEKQGFKAEVRTGVTLAVGQEAVVNVRLEVGELVQQVTVTAEVPVVNITTSPVSGVVSEREIKDLPLNGRSFDSLITLNPGAINYGLKSYETSTSNGNTFSVAGRRPAENLFLLNGVEYGGTSQLAVTPGGVSQELLGIDAVREFNILTDSYSAEYGKRSGAQVSVVTQSGTNVVHGAAFEFLRNSALDGAGIFDHGTPAPLQRNQFGGALGGPLKKNKLFLFGNYEGFQEYFSPVIINVVPDQNARQGLLPNASGVPTQVTGGNAAMLPYFSLWPQPNGAELLSNGVASGTAFATNSPQQSFHEHFGTTRLDYSLANRDSISGAYTIDDGNSLLPLTSDSLFASATDLRLQVASLQETHIFSPTMLNTFRTGYSRAGFNLNSAPLVNFPSSLSFVYGAGPGGITVNGGVTTSGISGISTTGPSNAAGVWNRRNLFTYADDLQFTRGRHQISVGVWFQRLRDNEDTASRTLGLATFTSLQTFEQGTVSQFQVVPDPNELGWRSWFGAWYVEDAIKLRPRLTIQLGLRHEFTTGWNEVSGRAANYVTNGSGILQTNPIVGSSIFTTNNAVKLFSPRIGLAWDVFGTGKTAIRAGAGTYYSLIDALSFLMNALPPTNGSATFTNVPLASVLPIIPGVQPPPSCGPGVTGTCSTFAPQGIQPDAKTPTVEEWNFTLEQQLNRNTSIRAAYVGSHGYHGMLSLDPNTIPAQVCSNASGCAAGGIATTAAGKATVPQGTQYIPVGSRPNQYLGAGFFWYTEGNSSYNALQVDVSHRLTKGLQFRANYTWSKNLDMNSGLTGAQANNQSQMILDRNDLSRDWGPSALNAANQAGISARYELPFGHGQQWLNNASGIEERLIGGWQVNSIVTLLSGFPFTPVIGTSRSGDGDTRNPDRPSLNPNFTGPVILGLQTEWFNPNAFALPTPGTYGNLGRGVYSGPGLAEIDLSFFKTTALSERAKLEFRAEFFNLMNRTNLGTPTSTVFSSGAISPSAGLITMLATQPRQVQLGLKLIF